VLGVIASFAALGAADFLWRKGQQVFAQGVTGTGIAVLYLSFYAAFGFYHLISQGFAFILMFSATGMAVALSLRYGSQAITALGLFGGYLTPLVLSTGEDRPWFLFGYVLLLSAAAIGLARMRNWRVLEALSFTATVFIYGSWLLNRFTRHEQRVVATLACLAYYALYSQASLRLLFILAQVLAALALPLVWSNSTGAFFFFALLITVGGLAYAERRGLPPVLSVAFTSFWVSYGLWELVKYAELSRIPAFFGITLAFLLFFGWFAWRLAVRGQVLSVQSLSILALNGIVYYGAAYALLNRPYHGYLGLLAVAVAGAYLGFGAYLYRGRAAANLDLRPVLLSLGMALCFITLAIPIQFTGFTITVAWSMQAAALTWIGLRFQSQKAVAGALFVFALVFIRLLLSDSSMFPDARAYQLLFNRRFATFVIAAISSFISAYWASSISRPIALTEYFGGHVVLLWGLTTEVIGWAERSTPPQNLLSVETVAVSILFGIYAVILVSVGVGTRTAINRIAGLGLIGIVIVKLYLFDVWQLGRVYRISAFVALGLLLLGTSFLYSRFRRLIESLWKDDEARS
ncbi:MAG: DUF2339 domain-containing protein, partial [Acidobacteriaceae bacterium]|nr:DUF2339 domain-containing protein [Acidobacteriaceae bacterium]